MILVLPRQDTDRSDAQDVALQDFAELVVPEEDIEGLIPGDVLKIAGDHAPDFGVENDVELGEIAEKEDDIPKVGVLEFEGDDLAREFDLPFRENLGLISLLLLPDEGQIIRIGGRRFLDRLSILPVIPFGRDDGRAGLDLHLGSNLRLLDGDIRRRRRRGGLLWRYAASRCEQGILLFEERNDDPLFVRAEVIELGFIEVEDHPGNGAGVAELELGDPDLLQPVFVDGKLGSGLFIDGVIDINDQAEGFFQSKDLGDCPAAELGAESNLAVLIFHIQLVHKDACAGVLVQLLLDLWLYLDFSEPSLDPVQLDDRPVFLGRHRIRYGLLNLDLQPGLLRSRLFQLNPRHQLGSGRLDRGLGSDVDLVKLEDNRLGRVVGSGKRQSRIRLQDDPGAQLSRLSGDLVYRGRRGRTVPVAAEDDQKAHCGEEQPKIFPFHVLTLLRVYFFDDILGFG